MTTTGYRNAKDEMFALINVAVTTGGPGIVGYIPEIRWPLDEQPDPTDLSKYWLRVSTQMVVEDQKALGNGQDGGKLLYGSAGLLFVQVFAPMTDKGNAAKQDALCALVKNSIRGKKTASGVWFRNVREQEIGAADKWQQKKVAAEFQYQEIG